MNGQNLINNGWAVAASTATGGMTFTTPLLSITGGTMTWDATGANNTYISVFPDNKSVINVDGASSHLLQIGTNTQFATSWDVNTVTTINVTNGGEMAVAQTADGLALLSENASGKTTITVSGAGSRLTMGDDVRLADNVSDATITVNGGATASFNSQLSMATLGDTGTDTGAGHAWLNVGTNSTVSVPVISPAASTSTTLRPSSSVARHRSASRPAEP